MNVNRFLEQMVDASRSIFRDKVTYEVSVYKYEFKRLNIFEKYEKLIDIIDLIDVNIDYFFAPTTRVLAYLEDYCYKVIEDLNKPVSSLTVERKRELLEIVSYELSDDFKEKINQDHIRDYVRGMRALAGLEGLFSSRQKQYKTAIELNK